MVWVVPLPATVTTRMIPFFVGNCYYKPSFATITRRGGQPKLWFHFSYIGFFIHLQHVLFRFFFWDFPFGTGLLFRRFFYVNFLQERQNLSKPCRPRPLLKKNQPTQAKSKQTSVLYFFYMILSSGVKIDFFTISVAPRSPGRFLPGRGVYGA